MKINKISPLKHKYLQIITNIAKSPSILYYTGSLPTERVATIAIVGTRKPTPYGKEVTERLSYDLAKRGVIVVSGLALGTDALAHKAALEAGGITMAVLPCGLPKIYPATNRQLAERMVEQGGALITEYAPGTDVAWQSNLLARNRIVAGLADALLITEASLRSGTLSTAARALEQGKEVFVVPGNITSPASAGCNALLKQGATPVTSAEDILQVIAPESLSAQTQMPLGANPTETAILTQLQAGLRDGEDIQRATGLPAHSINIALTTLELSGHVRSLGANQWAIK